MNSLYYFAQAYGEGNYGEGLYSCTQQQEDEGLCTVAAGGQNNGTGAGGNGTLTDTGIAVIGIASLACLLIFAALVVRVWRRPRKAVPTAQVTAPAPDRTGDSQSPTV